MDTNGSGREPAAKALELLGVLIDLGAPSVGVRELAAHTSMSVSTVHRILSQLEKMSLVERDVTGRYALGLELFRWGQKLVPLFPLREAAMPKLHELVKACNETAFLGVYNSRTRQMMYTASVESTHSLRYIIPLEEWRPVHAGASGLAILAFLSPQEQQLVIEETSLYKVTQDTITDRSQLRGMLEQIRGEGVAYSQGQTISGAVGIAAPILDANLNAIGDVVLTIPEQRFNPSDQPELARLIVDCVREISMSIGAPVDGPVWPPFKEAVGGARERALS